MLVNLSVNNHRQLIATVLDSPDMSEDFFLQLLGWKVELRIL